MVHEARGENRQAADCYRKVIAFIRQHPDGYDDAFEDAFVKLDPPDHTASSRFVRGPISRPSNTEVVERFIPPSHSVATLT
jgi:hypothetical protein